MHRSVFVLVGFLMLLPLFQFVSRFYPILAFDQLFRAPDRGNFEVGSRKGSDPLLSGLLPAGFDKASCLSRYQSAFYRKPSTHSPSLYLLTRLRKYESLHKKCGPNTAEYNNTRDQLNKSAHSTENSSECKYVIWVPNSGLGNRIITLASTFLYALLTNRVVLVDRGTDMVDLFCEPFPDTSWLLPLDFPLNTLVSFGRNSPQSFGNMLRDHKLNGSSWPALVYLHLAHDYSKFDKLFFCGNDQLVLEKVPWLVLLSNNYFVPSFFQMPEYEQELRRLFPQPDTVFHHLGRYLFHPTNSVWGLITRSYQAYLAQADDILGIQIRIFDADTKFQQVLDQILACSQRERLLPEISKNRTFTPHGAPMKRLKTILITSLSPGYSDSIRNMYWESATASGEIVRVYQPSHEEIQQTEKQAHNMKAWAEIYLLSLSDTLLTSSWSTFGYVGQGLGGLTPWILARPLKNGTVPNPPCGRDISMEPCFHAPPNYDCKAKRTVYTGSWLPHVRHCEDVRSGVKLVDRG